MHCQSNTGVCQRKNSGPDADIPAEIETNRVRPAIQNIPRTKPEGSRKKYEAGIRRPHAEPVPDIWRRRRQIRNERNCDGGGSEK